MTVKILTDNHLRFLSFKGGCIGSSESTLVKMPHCWRSHATTHITMGFLMRFILFQYYTIIQPDSSSTDDAFSTVGLGGKRFSRM